MKKVLIIIGIVLSVILLGVIMIFSSNNRAIGYEEQVKTSKSDIQIQEKRRADLIVNLVDTIKNYDKFEKDTLNQVMEARNKATNGNVEEAKIMINAVAEQYPELKSIENYKYLMTELSTTENLIAIQRESYNTRVKEYNRYVKKFPTHIFLNISGYEIQNYNYLEYTGLEDSPKNLFDE